MPPSITRSLYASPPNPSLRKKLRKKHATSSMTSPTPSKDGNVDVVLIHEESPTRDVARFIDHNAPPLTCSGKPTSGKYVEQTATNKYGYEDAKPEKDYGYEDATPDVAVNSNKYGYEDAVPDLGHRSPHANRRTTKTPKQLKDYGYGDGAPDVAAGAPGAGDDKYGYGDGEPTLNSNHRHMRPRKSSMKHGSSYGTEGRRGGRRRRSTISHNGEISVILPGKSKPTKRKTSIQFAETAEVQEVTPVSSLTNEPEKLWFQEKEYSKIKERIFQVVDYAEAHPPEKNSKRQVCTRGLEKIMSGRASTFRTDAWDSVLDEQHLQRHEGTYDDEGMANVYRRTSMGSKAEARRLAEQDAKDIEGYMQTTLKRFQKNRRCSC